MAMPTTMTKYHLALCLASTVLLGTHAAAQTVQVRPKAGSQGWDVSYSRRYAPGVFEMDTTCATLAAARREATSLKAWSNQMDPASMWRLAVILIEGDDIKPSSSSGPNDSPDATKPPGDGPKLFGFLETMESVITAKNFVDDPLKVLQEKLDPDKGLKDYAKNIEGAYARAKQAKEDVLKLTGKLADDEMSKVNALIDKYNGESQVLSKPTGFDGLPKMTRIDDQSLKVADGWRAEKKEQFRLEAEKQRLDDWRFKLEAERQKLLDEYGVVGDPVPVSLRERAEKFREQSDLYSTELGRYEKEITPRGNLVAGTQKTKGGENRDLIKTAWGGGANYASGGGGKVSIWFDTEDTGRVIYGVAQDVVMQMSWTTDADEILVYPIYNTGVRAEHPIRIKRSGTAMKGSQKSRQGGYDKYILDKGAGLGKSID